MRGHRGCLLTGFSSLRRQWATGECPAEWLGEDLVEVFDETHQLLPQVGYRAEAASPNDLPGDRAEDDFNLVQPRRVLGQVQETDTMAPIREEFLPRCLRVEDAHFPFLPQLLLDVAGLRHPPRQALRTMDVQVIHHENPRRPRIGRHRLGHMGHKVLFRPCWPQCRCHELPRDYVKVGDQRQRA